MKFHPKRKLIIGRTVDVQQTRTGIQLPDGVKQVTCFVHVDEVGPEVTQAKVGDLILHLKLNHIFLRDNTHAVVVHDDDVLCAVEVTAEERRRLCFEGQKDYEGGAARAEHGAFCPGCLKAVDDTPENAELHRKCLEDLEAARLATENCPHAEVNEHRVCMGCGGLRGDDGTFEPPVRPFRRVDQAEARAS